MNAAILQKYVLVCLAWAFLFRGVAIMAAQPPTRKCGQLLGGNEDLQVKHLNGSGIDPVFPLWQRPTQQLAQSIVQNGIRAVLTCVDPKALAESFVGREYNEALLADLPDNVDPCGENGEFHTFVFDGPMFRQPISIRVTEKVQRDGFIFADVCPV